jgi:large subunit ribosomal protein L18e
MKSKTSIKSQLKKKTNPELVDAINKAKNSDNVELAGLLSTPTRKRIELNLEQIDKEGKDGETVIIPGKVLGKGNIKKKIKIIAYSFSGSAIEKLQSTKTQFSLLKDALENNKKVDGRILR